MGNGSKHRRNSFPIWTSERAGTRSFGPFPQGCEAGRETGKDLAKLRRALTLLAQGVALPRNAVIMHCAGTGTDFVTCTSNRIGCRSAALGATRCSLHGPARIRTCSADDRRSPTSPALPQDICTLL